MRRSTRFCLVILCSIISFTVLIASGPRAAGRAGVIAGPAPLGAVPPAASDAYLVPPVAGFTGWTLNGVGPHTVSFTDLSIL